MSSVHWMIPDFVFQGHEKSVALLGLIPLASLRMRAFPAIRALEEKGIPVTFGEHIAGAPSKIFIGKIGGIDINNRMPVYLDEMRRHKANGAKLYLDYTDHHLGLNTAMAPFYREAITLTDVAVVSSTHMSTLLRPFYAGEITVIEDALDIAVHPVKATAQKERTLLWFGHESNIQYLIDFIRTGFAAGDAARVFVLSSAKGLEMFRAAKLQSPAKLEFVLFPWSPGQTIEAARHADACIIPIDPTDPNKAGASSNRLITALALGLPTAADNVASYQEFSAFYTDLRGPKFRLMLKNPAAFHKFVIKAQREVVPRFSFENVKQAWAALV